MIITLNQQRLRHSFIILYFLFAALVVWRTVLFVLPATPDDTMNLSVLLWGSGYQIIALYGAFIGFVISRAWGGRNSLLGRTVLAFSFGLLMQSWGQTFASYYVIKLGDVPYPSLADIGFFGSIFFYIYGAWGLAKMSGIRPFVKSWKTLMAWLLTIISIGIAYYIFLAEATMDISHPIQSFLNFGYPLGQAIYIAIVLTTLLLLRSVTGGVMKAPIVIFLVALVVQYLSDFIFLYQAIRDLYIPGGVIDILYLTAYFLMSLAILKLGRVFQELKNT